MPGSLTMRPFPTFPGGLRLNPISTHPTLSLLPFSPFYCMKKRAPFPWDKSDYLQHFLPSLRGEEKRIVYLEQITSLMGLDEKLKH